MKLLRNTTLYYYLGKKIKYQVCSISNQFQFRTMASNSAPVKEGILLGLGNPLLDITIEADDKFLNKYKLEKDNAIPAKDQHKPMFKEMMTRYEPQFLPGGATMNSIRVAQWILQEPKATTFFGCVGDDKYAEILRKNSEGVGVNACFQVNPEIPTGICGAIITGGDNRSLVSNLGAARFFDHKFLQEPDNWALVKKADYYYIGGYVFPVSQESIKMIAEHASANDKTLIMNLSATFLCRYFSKSDIDILEYIDILIGNESEAEMLSKQLDFGTEDIHDIAFKVMSLPKKNANRGRIVIFTQGKGPLTVARNGEIEKYEIQPVHFRDIKDGNGCGDAFMGGFLAQLVKEREMIECIRCGNYAASEVLKHWGCSFPDKPEYDEDYVGEIQ